MTRMKPPDLSCKRQKEHLARFFTQLSGGRSFRNCLTLRSLPLAFLVLAHSGCGYHSRTECSTSAPSLALTSINSPLPDKAFNADISLPYGLPALKAGQTEFISVIVQNDSDVVWPALGQREARHSDYKYYIKLGAHWFDATGATPVQDDERVSLPYDLQPRQQAEFLVRVVPPKLAGSYTLEFDMVQEGISWFSLKGSKALTFKVTID